MGTTEEKCYLYGSCKCQTAGCVARPDKGCPVYRYFKDLIVKDYENRLKSDMAAILENLKKEMNPIKECEQQIYGKEEWNFVRTCQDVVQGKIDALGGKTDVPKKEK